MNDRTLFVSEQHRLQIDELRMQEYSKAKGFTLDLNTLMWKQSDSDSFVMAIESNGTLVSTMRGEIITSKKLLEEKLECPWNFPLELDYPILLLSRAATHSSHRSLGLNLVLRYWFLKFASHHQIPYVLGTFVAGSPRENTLREMGYEFFENKLGWQQSSYRSHAPVSVVALNMKAQGQAALHFCENKIPHLIEQYQMSDAFPEIKIVTGL